MKSHTRSLLICREKYIQQGLVNSENYIIRSKFYYGKLSEPIFVEDFRLRNLYHVVVASPVK